MNNIQREDSFQYGHSHDQLSKRSKARYYKKQLIILSIVVILISKLIYYSIQKYQQTSTYSKNIDRILPIHAGQIHYSRVPWQYWQHRIKMIKSMGLNTLSVYVMWNFHQIQKGKFDFTTQNKNLVDFLNLAKSQQMKVLLRPGPYVCAQWDFGGLPPRLLGIQGLQIRSSNPEYQRQVFMYFSALSEVIRPYLFSNGGPIIMIQIQNELGYYSDSNIHTLNLIKMWKDLKIQSEFYYEDAYQNWDKQYWQDAHIGISGGSSHLAYHLVQISPLRSNNSFIFGGQIYSGWLTHWGQKWGQKSSNKYYQQLRGLVIHNKSVNVYVAFGGTNFGLTAGANGYEPNVFNLFNYRSHITSYDYDAPINEQGRATYKYHLIQSIFQQYYGNHMPAIPQPIKTIPIPAFLPKIQAHLWPNLPRPTIVDGELTYFQSDQLQMYRQGIVIYQTTLNESKDYKFNLTVHDLGIIYLNQQFVKTFVRNQTSHDLLEIKCQKQPCILRVLIQAMGHINYGRQMGKDRKGLLDFYQISDRSLSFKWNIYKLPIDENIFNWNKKSATMTFPVLFKTVFEIDEIGDTFISFKDYVKGYVWINGVLLGRYWNVGPQQRLYCPAVWLKDGSNQVYILELLHQKYEYVKGYQKLKK